MRMVISLHSSGYHSPVSIFVLLSLHRSSCGADACRTMDCSSQHAGIFTPLADLWEGPGALTHSLLFSRRKRKVSVCCWGGFKIFKGLGQVHGGRNLSEALPLVGGLSKEPRNNPGRLLSKWYGCLRSGVGNGHRCVQTPPLLLWSVFCCWAQLA